MNPAAAQAIEWTRGELQATHKDFLASLGLRAREDDRLYVHASPKNPESWPYVASAEDAAIALSATTARIAFCGHLHKQALFGVTATGKLASFNPQSASPIPLVKPRRWLARLGAVGQPRDGDPSAAFCLFDTSTNEIRFMRVPYDVAAAMAKIRAAGLPESLALRLAEGR
jgi:diadenosine tetraphosphatase ApaH/serine/threonine PP2A family protein phosphatase